MICPYRKIAAERWRGSEVNGSGRYALLLRKDSTVIAVYLTADESIARASQAFYDSVVIDLKPTDFDKIPDRYDADDRRREARERAQ